MKQIKEAKNVELNHSNMMNESFHESFKTSRVGFFKTSPTKQDPGLIKLRDGGEDILQELKVTSRIGEGGFEG